MVTPLHVDVGLKYFSAWKLAWNYFEIISEADDEKCKMSGFSGCSANFD